jgi:hypothetical protein
MLRTEGREMVVRTLTPTDKRVTVEIPDEYINHPVRISVVRLDADAAQRRKEIDALFAEFETDLSEFKFNRDELYDR